ncbi:GAF and ANTAR domain-containing protein [Amycolatopsis sp.]|jgi:transcriptional regulator with GAF, ATPase, and Fis domain|uniref:GAF and ANTAR domain-containing protein n=1 Tax=Amycolatopsis sp. TaxID=37632 RepID=UPI002E040C24|nr:GAF and ANTAR domain-containing protein [Amycolatopsis sp.]
MNDDTSPDAVREPQLLQAFVQMADTLVDDYDVVDVLHQLVEHSLQLLPVAAAGIMLSDQRGHLQVLASSTEQARLLELFQVQNDEGPCLDCVRTRESVLVADLSETASRWPRFAPQALREGFSAVHAVPLRLRRETIGALNLFGREPGLLGERDLQVARALADIATIGILQERAIRRGEVLTEQLQTALNSRVAIEQAKGALAHAGNLDMDQAFAVLRFYARKNNARLSEVAHQIVTGALRLRNVLDPQHISGC